MVIASSIDVPKGNAEHWFIWTMTNTLLVTHREICWHYNPHLTCLYIIPAVPLHGTQHLKSLHTWNLITVSLGEPWVKTSAAGLETHTALMASVDISAWCLSQLSALVCDSALNSHLVARYNEMLQKKITFLPMISSHWQASWPFASSLSLL